MKFTLFMLVAACACAAYAHPADDAKPAAATPPSLVVQIDVDEFITELRQKFNDEGFLQSQLGDFNAPKPAAPADGTVQQGWTKFVPWGQVLDFVVDVVKKVAKEVA